MRDSTALAVGAAVSGLLAYVFFAVSTRSLGASEAAPVSVLWTYWSFTAAALTFPLQHWLTRTVAAHGGEGAARSGLPGVAGLVVAGSVLAGCLAWLVREPLFGRTDPWFPVLVGAVTLGSAVVGVVRGSLSARQRFLAVAIALVLENLLRCIAALVLVAVHDESAVDLGVCLAAGALACAVWPSAFRFRREAAGDSHESPLRFLSGVSAGQLLAQAVLTGGPVLLALSGGSAAEVTALFAALALFRAPYTFAIGQVSQLTGRLTVLFVRGQHPELRRVRLLVLTSTLLSTAAAGALGGLAGPELLRWIFGPGVHLSAGLAALLAIGSAAALASLVMTVMIMAQNRGVAVARAWSIAVLGGGLLFALLPAEPLTRTCWAFVAAESVALVALVVEELLGAGERPSSVPAAPSPPGTTRAGDPSAPGGMLG